MVHAPIHWQWKRSGLGLGHNPGSLLATLKIVGQFSIHSDMAESGAIQVFKQLRYLCWNTFGLEKDP